MFAAASHNIPHTWCYTQDHNKFFTKYLLLFSTKADSCMTVLQVAWLNMERILATTTNLLYSAASFCHKCVL